MIAGTTFERAAAEILASAVRNDAGCLIPTIGYTARGYSRINIGRPSYLAHRVVMSAHEGRELATDETVDHTCHNGSGCSGGPSCLHRACVDPEHLEVVDGVTNWRRGTLGVVAQRRAQTECSKGHPLSGDNVSLYGSANTYRRCLECHKQSQRAYLARKAVA